MKHLFIITILSGLTLFSCKGEKKLTDNEKIEKSIRNYLFLGDSVDVTFEITDTIHTEELDGMLSTTEENLGLIQLDIDTLGIIIDDLSYQIQNGQQNGAPVDLNKENQLLKYKLKYEQLSSQKRQFTQTNRILLHFKRSIWANIAGFEVAVKYSIEDKNVETMVMMDANYRIID